MPGRDQRRERSGLAAVPGAAPGKPGFLGPAERWFDCDGATARVHPDSPCTEAPQLSWIYSVGVVRADWHDRLLAEAAESPVRKTS